MIMIKGLILTDCREIDKDIFLKKLVEKTSVEFENLFLDTSRWQKGIGNVLRYLSYVFIPLYILIINKEYDYIVSWQQFYGIFYAFWCNLFKVKKKKKLIIMTFIYKGKKGNIGKIYFKMMRSIVRSGYIDAFVCFSETECQEYAKLFNIDKKYFFNCKLSVDDNYERFKKLINDGDYYLSVGRSNRDYDFLCDAFEQFTERKLVIICDKYHEKVKHDNIEILNNTYDDEYFKYLAGCKAVLIPLNKDVVISSGQLVAIHGMMFGKIVIATDTGQMREYIRNNENGFLIPNTTDALGEILNYIESRNMGDMTERIREDYLQNYYNDCRSDVVAQIIKNI